MDIDFQEERRSLRTPPCPATDIPCSECGQFLVKSSFLSGFRLMCDNHECSLFREGQGIELRVQNRKLGQSQTMKAYLKFLQRTSKNYHYLRSLGFNPHFAKRFQSTKQTERITKLVERGVSPEFITANLQ